MERGEEGLLAGGQPEIVGGESETFPLAETVDSPLRQQPTIPALMSTWQSCTSRRDWLAGIFKIESSKELKEVKHI